MNNEQTLEFIEDYRSYECLWDIHSKLYTNKTRRSDAYTELANKYNITEKAVRNKIKSLRSYFSKENQKANERKSGAGSESLYEPTWFAYRALLFIADSVTPRQTKDSFTVRKSGSTSFDEANVELSDENNEEGDNVTRCSVTTPCQPSISPLEINLENGVSGNKAVPEPIRTQRNILKRKRDDDEKNEAEALKFLNTAATAIIEKDDCAIYGQMIATELRKLNPRNKAIAKNKIQNIIFDLQMEEMSDQTFIVTSPRSHLDGRSSHGSMTNIPSPKSPSVLTFGNRANTTTDETEMDQLIIFNLHDQQLNEISK